DAQSQNDQINAEQAQTEVHNSSNEKTEGQHFGSAVLQVGLIDIILQAARDGHPSEQIAEEREPATPFAAYQVAGRAGAGAAGDTQFPQTAGQPILRVLPGYAPGIISRHAQSAGEDQECEKKEHRVSRPSERAVRKKSNREDEC